MVWEKAQVAYFNIL